jgi:hypothetical protein
MKEKDDGEQKDTSESYELKASDIKTGIGLSYRQLNDWDSKGIIPSNRKESSAWRRFTFREAFVLMICKEIRDAFGVPLDSLGFIKKIMLKDGIDYFKVSLSMMQKGLYVHLLTDLKGTFILDTDLEFKDLLDIGFFRCDEPMHFIFMSINPLINRMLSITGRKPFAVDEELYKEIYVSQAEALRITEKEKELIRLIRNKEYTRIVAHLNNGQIIRIDTEEEITDKLIHEQEKAILNIIKEKQYQTISVHIANGKIVRASRKTPTKYSKATEKP